MRTNDAAPGAHGTTVGTQHRDTIGYFVVREAEGTAELEIVDSDLNETREEAEAWIANFGIPGIDYWICQPVNTVSRRRI